MLRSLDVYNAIMMFVAFINLIVFTLCINASTFQFIYRETNLSTEIGFESSADFLYVLILFS